MNKIGKILLIVLGVPALVFVGLVIYEVTIGFSESPSEEVKKPPSCSFTREPEETWPDETASDPPIGNVELIKNAYLIETYDVFGSNLSEVRDSMNKDGPIIIKQKVPNVNMSVKGVAYAGGNVGVIWRKKNTAAGCILTKANVTINITLILPNWANKAAASDQDQEMWDLYLKFLKRHEQGHINMGLKAARELQAELAQLKPAPSCKELDGKISVLYDEMVQKGEEDGVNYDNRTNYGVTQRPDLLACNWSELRID